MHSVKRRAKQKREQKQTENIGGWLKNECGWRWVMVACGWGVGWFVGGGSLGLAIFNWQDTGLMVKRIQIGVGLFIFMANGSGSGSGERWEKRLGKFKYGNKRGELMYPNRNRYRYRYRTKSRATKPLNRCNSPPLQKKKTPGGGRGVWHNGWRIAKRTRNRIQIKLTSSQRCHLSCHPPSRRFLCPFTQLFPPIPTCLNFLSVPWLFCVVSVVFLASASEFASEFEPP